jgi:hypothetical protein
MTNVTQRTVGDSITLHYELRVGETLTDADVACTVTKPDGTAPTVDVDRISLGTYETALALDQPGLWRYRFTATGDAVDAEDGSFFVEAAAGADLYVTVGELRRELGARPGQLDDGLLLKACRSASRSVDLHCHQRFWLDPVPVARLFRAEWPWELDTPPIGAATAVVTTDDQGSGTFGGAWTAGVDYQLEPLNAPADGGAWRYSRIVAVGSLRFPTLPWTHRPGVSILTRWGWSMIPETVREASTLLAMRLYRRKDTPLGFEGFQDFGVARITRTDPDIAVMLSQFTIPVLA